MTSDTQPQPLIPGLASFYDTFAPRGYALIRFGFGAILMRHGYPKLFAGFAPILGTKFLGPMGFPAPIAWAYFLGVLEFFGGALLALGLFTRPIALMLAVEMAVITFDVSFPHGFFFSAPGGGYEFPLLMLILSVGFLLSGGGRCSIDRAIGKEF